MNSFFNLYISIFLFCLINCKSTIKSSENGKLNHEAIVLDLTKRGYDVEINTHKGIKSYVTVYPKTLVLENDLGKICNLPNLRNLRIDNANVSSDFFNHLDSCDLSSLSLLSIGYVSWKDGILCKVSSKKNTQEYLHLTDTNFADSDLKCISNFQYIKNLSFEGPSQKFSDDAFCSLMQSGLKIESLDLRNIVLTTRAYNCLLDLKEIEVFSFRKIKGRTASDMKKLENLYFKKNGRKILVEVFGYDSL